MHQSETGQAEARDLEARGWWLDVSFQRPVEDSTANFGGAIESRDSELSWNAKSRK